MTTPIRSNDELEGALYRDPEILAKSLKPSVVSSIDTLRDTFDLNEEEVQQHLESAATVMFDANIASQDAATLYRLIVKHSIAPADQETRNAWATESRKLIREEYGDAGNHRLEAVRNFIEAHPDLEGILAETGLGDHPKVIAALAEQAFSLRPTPRPRPDAQK